MAVGDDAQCIYSWRGADFENIMSFPDRHPGTIIHRIETNYRSTPEILALANGVLLAQPKGRHFDKELRAGARPRGQKPYVVQTMDDREQAEFILKRIRALTEDEGVSANNIAILYRSHFLALEVQLALSRAGIPYQITSGVKFFERQHVRDLIGLLRFVYNPSDQPSAWQRIAVLLSRKSARRARKKSTPRALDHARLVQKGFPRYPHDRRRGSPRSPRTALRPEWESFCASLSEVAEAMRHDKPARAVELAIDGWRNGRLPARRVRRLHRPTRRVEGPRRLRVPLRRDAGPARADRPAQRRDQQNAMVDPDAEGDQADHRAPGEVVSSTMWFS